MCILRLFFLLRCRPGLCKIVRRLRSSATILIVVLHSASSISVWNVGFAAILFVVALPCLRLLSGAPLVIDQLLTVVPTRALWLVQAKAEVFVKVIEKQIESL